jgi:hypothetical protein
MKIQSVIFNKKHWTKARAEQWLKNNNYKTSFYGKGVDETPNFYRYRQMAPSRFKNYITKKLKKSKSHKDNGIQLVIGLN